MLSGVCHFWQGSVLNSPQAYACQVRPVEALLAELTLEEKVSLCWARTSGAPHPLDGWRFRHCGLPMDHKWPPEAA